MFGSFAKTFDAYVEYCKANNIPLPKVKLVKQDDVTPQKLSPPVCLVYYLDFKYKGKSMTINNEQKFDDENSIKQM
jgi:hypothetical protein